ncbi:MAG: polysaccharide biosynthesis tyrosine autokinase [Nitrospinota bacterium]|nr:polysaccharide biosynthesis tyrosine autokinase [Nitrospinota bacterium]
MATFHMDHGDNEPNIEEILGTVKKYKWGIISVCFITTVMGVLWASSLTPIYQAQVTLLVEPEQPKVVSMDVMTNTSNIYFFYRTQEQIIQSRKVANAVVEKLKLSENKEFTGEKEEGEKTRPSLRQWLREAFASKEEDPEKEKEQGEEYKPNYAGMVQAGVTATTGEDSQIITITYESDNPQLAAEIANGLAEAYIESGLEARLSMMRKATSWLSERLAELRDKLSESEMQLSVYQSNERIMDSQSQHEMMRRKLVGVTEKLVLAQTQRLEAETRYRHVKEVMQNDKNYNSLSAILNSPLVDKLTMEQVRLERTLAELEQRYGHKHPTLIRARSDMEEARQRLREEIITVFDSMKKEYELAMENEASLANLSEETKNEIRLIKMKEFELSKREREVATNRQLYETFLSRFKETNITQDASFTNVHVIDKAQVPMYPVKPRKRMIVASSLFGGLIIGILLAFVREKFDKTFSHWEDVEKILQLPALGAIPFMKSIDIGKYILGRDLLKNPNERFAETIQDVRTSILLANLDAAPKVIMVTSSAPEEGKTSFTCNLSFSFANLGKTLLVDLDLRKPRLPKVLGLKQSPGLVELLSGAVKMEDAIQQDENHPNMQYLTSGIKAHNPLEIISSRKFKDTIAELREIYDYVLIDTAPVMLFSDALVVGQMADAVLMMIKADQTPYHIARETLKRLRSSNIPPLGAVLSHVDFTRNKSGYYHYYSSYYSDRDDH